MCLPLTQCLEKLPNGVPIKEVRNYGSNIL